MEKKRPKAHFHFWYLLLAVIAVLLINNYIASFYEVERIPYSRFIELLNARKIKEVTINDNIISGKMEGENGDPVKEKRFATVRVDPELSQKLSDFGVDYSGQIENTFLRDLLSWVLPALIFVAIWILLMRRFSRAQGGFMSVGKSKAKIYMEEDTRVSFSDVAGVDEAKDELKEIIEFLRFPEKFQRLGGKIPKGILLVGPPGTGKTLLARAVAGESGVTFFSISGSEFVEMFVGVGAARVRDLFTQAREKAPCIIFIDELDALGKARGINVMGGHDEREQTLNQLLVEMDGFDPKLGVILMAATNRPEILDPALLRAGRFDRHVLVDRPDKKGREEILKIHARNVKLGADVKLEEIAAFTPGFVGADLANLVNEAALLAVRHGKEDVGKVDFEHAVERIIAGLEKKNRLLNPVEKKIVAHHEVGHALVALMVKHADPVHKISVIPRGIAALGYTLQMPTEDRYLMTKNELLDKIAVLLGGRAAEQIIFGDVSTGAHNDLVRATEIARSMVTEYGMSEKLGRVSYEKDRRGQFLTAISQPVVREFSEETAREIDSEIKKIIDHQYRQAADLLNAHKEVLRQAADYLMEKETITGDELKSFLKDS